MAPKKERRVSVRFESDDSMWLKGRARALRLTVSDVLRMVVWKARTRGETFSDLGPDAESARKAGGA